LASGWLLFSVHYEFPLDLPHLSRRLKKGLNKSTMAPKQYRQPPQAPPSFTATPASLLEDARSLCGTTRTLLDKIAAEITPETATFENVILPIAENEDKSGLQDRIISFYQVVSGDSQLRTASSLAEQIIDEFQIEASMREDIFKLVDTVHKNSAKLDPESQMLLEKTRKSYIANGLGIPAGLQRDRFKVIKKRLSQINTEFQRNLNEEHGCIWFTEKQLEGVPSDIVSRLENRREANEIKYRLTFKYADIHSTLKFALDAEVRQKVFIENENKVSQAPLWWDEY
jgi:metallopeptidase MepB